MAREQPGHFRGRFQAAVDRALAPEAGLLDRAAFADAGDDVLQDAPLRHVIEHVAGRDGGHARGLRHVGQLAQPDGIAGPAAQRQREIAAVREVGAQACQAAGERVIRGVRQQNGDQAIAVRGEVLPVEMAGAFPRAPLAERQQPAELRIPGPVGRIDQHGQAVAADRAGSRRPGGRRLPRRADAPARCRPACCGR